MKNGIILSLIAVILHSCSPSNETLMSESQLGQLQSTDSIQNAATVFSTDSVAYERISTGEIVGITVFNNEQKKTPTA